MIFREDDVLKELCQMVYIIDYLEVKVLHPLREAQKVCSALAELDMFSVTPLRQVYLG